MRKDKDVLCFMRLFAAILGLGAALVLSSACGGGAPPAFSEEDRLLEKLMEEYVAARLRFYPVESTIAGLPGNDDRLGSYSRVEVANRIAALSDFHKKLMGLRPEALSQQAYLDALWLTSLTKTELFELEERRLWERTAAFYTDSVRTGLVALLLAPDVASRTESLRGRLEAIPDLLEQARENLGGSTGPYARDGLASMRLCASLLADLPELLEDRVPSYRVAELAELSRLGTRALQQLEAFLAHAPGRDGEAEGVLGAAGLRHYFLYREMVDWEPERMLREAEAVLERIRNEVIEIALDRFPDRSLSELLASGAGSVASPGEAVSAYRDEVVAFVRESQGDAGAPEATIPVTVVPPYFLAPDALRLWRPASLTPAREAALLVSASPTDVLPRELELLTLREVAGRYRLYVLQSESPSLLRRIARTRAAGEGWASWILSKQLERGYGGDDPELRLRHLQLQLLDALRLSATVRVHAFGTSPSEIERDFRIRGFLSPARAESETDRLVVDPGAASAGLGRLLLDELAHDYRHQNPLVSESDLETQLLSESLVPLRLVRFKLLGIEDE